MISVDNVLIAVLSTQTALIIFVLERIFAIKKCLHKNAVRIARIEERLEVLMRNAGFAKDIRGLAYGDQETLSEGGS